MRMPQRATIITVDPATGAKGLSYSLHSTADLEIILARAGAAFRDWRESELAKRTEGLRKLAVELRKRKPELAELMRREMGKHQEDGEAEVEKCATCAEYYAAQGPAFLAPVPVATDARKSYVAYEPIGPVLAIMPWNFPFWQVVRCAVPALLAGNTLVLKHASNVPGCALALADLFANAFGRDDLLQSILVRGADTLPIVARPEIAAVSLTGSTEAGRGVAEAAGRALKKCVLELGGSDAYVVLADADLSRAAEECAKSRLINAGQSCISAKRFLVENSVLEEFTQLFLTALTRPTLAPLARPDLREELQRQVEASIALGARLLCGGKIPEGPGAFYPATALAGVRPGMPVFDEETFGPVAAIVGVSSEEEAITFANRSPFGLGAAVFTRDLARGERIAQKSLAAGSGFVNAFVRSDSRLPFGGVKQSGYGRELGPFGLHEFVNIKTIYVA